MALLAAVVTACADSTGAEPGPGGAAYDLVFDGTGPAGYPILLRVSGEGGTPAPVAGGIIGENPAPSPDGRTLVFQTLSTDADPPRLMILQPGSSQAVPLEGDDGFREVEPTWSPTGGRLAFVSHREDGAGDVFVARVEGRTLRNVRNLTPIDGGDPFPQPDRTPAWSPDGTRIAFTAYRGGGAALWVMNADGTGARPVTEEGQYGDYFPSWSPDGQRLVFQRTSGGASRIGIVSVNGGEPRFLPWQARAYSPVWSPDGRGIAFVSNVDGTDDDVFVVSPEWTELARIRRAGRDRNPAWVRRTAAP